MNVRKLMSTAMVPVTMASMVILGGCNADSGDTNISTSQFQAPLTGRLIDSPVQGVASATASVDASMTANNGQFGYRKNEAVTFTIGELLLGVAEGGSLLTPVDLVDGARVAHSSGTALSEVYSQYPAVINIARMLQSLDVDSASINGLQIPAEAHELAKDFQAGIDFSDPALYDSASSDAVKFICAVKVARDLVSADDCDETYVVSKAKAESELNETEEAIAAGDDINYLPNVYAGPDQRVVKESTVLLAGTASDVDGTISSVLWRETDQNGLPKSNPIVITNADQRSASFTAPAVTKDQVFYFTLTATDDDGDKGRDIVNVLVTVSENAAPTADAGPDQFNVPPDSTVVLDGSGSFDPDNDPITYKWTQTAGPSVNITDDTAEQTTFVVPPLTSNTDYAFNLHVTDDQGAFGDSTVNIHVVVGGGTTNQPPTAVATADPTAAESGQTVTLDASNSTDDDGSITAWEWAQIDSGPATGVDGQTTKSVEFTAPEVAETTEFSFTVKVTDNDGASDTSDSVKVTVTPAPSAPGTCDQTNFDPAACADTFCGTLPQGGTECADFASQITACGSADAFQTCMYDACEATVGMGDPSACDPFEGGGTGTDPAACDPANPDSYEQCFTDCSDGIEATTCPLPVEGDPSSPEQLQALQDQFAACSDQDPATVCPIPIEDQPGGGDPVACDTMDPTTYEQCYADCTDQDDSTVCPLPDQEGVPETPEEVQMILDAFYACASGDPSCQIPLEEQPNPTATFIQGCYDNVGGDAGTGDTFCSGLEAVLTTDPDLDPALLVENCETYATATVFAGYASYCGCFANPTDPSCQPSM